LLSEINSGYEYHPSFSLTVYVNILHLQHIFIFFQTRLYDKFPSVNEKLDPMSIPAKSAAENI